MRERRGVLVLIRRQGLVLISIRWVDFLLVDLTNRLNQMIFKGCRDGTESYSRLIDRVLCEFRMVRVAKTQSRYSLVGIFLLPPLSILLIIKRLSTPQTTRIPSSLWINFWLISHGWFIKIFISWTRAFASRGLGHFFWRVKRMFERGISRPVEFGSTLALRSSDNSQTTESWVVSVSNNMNILTRLGIFLQIKSMLVSLPNCWTVTFDD